MDGLFLHFFNIAPDEFINNVREHSTDEDLERWFLRLHGVTPEKIRQWNNFVVPLGSAGTCSHSKFQKARKTIYFGCDDPGVQTFYDIIDWDEGRFPNPDKSQYLT
jgi:hypothetical protein